jgi:hypothetical protein
MTGFDFQGFLSKNRKRFLGVLRVFSEAGGSCAFMDGLHRTDQIFEIGCAGGGVPVSLYAD